MKKLLIIPAVIGLAACSPSKLHLTDPKAAEESVECKYDDFAKITKCSGMSVSTPDKSAFAIGGASGSVALVALYPDKGDVTVGMIGGVGGTEWVFPERVIDNDGKELPMVKTNSEVFMCLGHGACVLREEIAITLDRNYIKKHKDTGFSIKIYGKKEALVIAVPAQYVEGFNNFLNNRK